MVNNMKKLLMFFITAAMLLSVAACSSSFEPVELPQPPEPAPATLEQAEELFTLWWSKWDNEIRYMGEEDALFVFETGDLRFAVSRDCGTIFYDDRNSWTEDGYIAVRDESRELPELFITEVSSGGLSYMFVNQTEREFMYGEDFLLYVRRGGGWRLLNRDMAFNSIGYSIMPLSMTLPRELRWDWSLGELRAGEYKLEKGFHFGSGGELEFYTAEQIFTIPRINS
jgi:predicted small lipoprotein YifL